jgi:nucleoside-diphosphate-sugar epimerase
VLGGAALDRFVGDPAVRRLVAVDTTSGHRAGVSWRVADVRDPAMVDHLAGVDCVVHLATDRSLVSRAEDRRAVNIRGTRLLLEAAVAAGARRVVLLTSAMVYGAAAANDVPLDEDGPLDEHRLDGLAGEWIAMEQAAAAVAGEIEVSVVRPASLVGTISDALLPALFEGVRLLAIRDARCHWQFCHIEDCVEALAAAAVGAVSGHVTVGCDGWLERADVERISGLRSIVLPAPMATVAAERLHRIGVLSSPATDIDYITHPWVVGSQRLRAIGWVPGWTNESALRAHLDLLGDRAGRGLLVVDRVDATRAAAGATLAVVGSLALARFRRRGGP